MGSQYNSKTKRHRETMVDSIAESARKASAGTWRKPRVRIYDYNQDIGSNYYQPMIKYINDKEVLVHIWRKSPSKCQKEPKLVQTSTQTCGMMTNQMLIWIWMTFWLRLTPSKSKN